MPSISLFSFEFIAYVPDYKSYSKNQGLTIDYLQEFPGEVTFNESELIQALKQQIVLPTKRKSSLFKKTYNYGDGKATERVLKLIEAIMNQSL